VRFFDVSSSSAASDPEAGADRRGSRLLDGDGDAMRAVLRAPGDWSPWLIAAADLELCHGPDGEPVRLGRGAFGEVRLGSAHSDVRLSVRAFAAPCMRLLVWWTSPAWPHGCLWGCMDRPRRLRTSVCPPACPCICRSLHPPACLADRSGLAAAPSGRHGSTPPHSNVRMSVGLSGHLPLGTLAAMVLGQPCGLEQVFLAKLKGMSLVAVKRLSPEQSDQSVLRREEFVREVALLKSLSNPHIVQFQVCKCHPQ
jgi:serine/threonine protein kinase